MNLVNKIKIYLRNYLFEKFFFKVNIIFFILLLVKILLYYQQLKYIRYDQIFQIIFGLNILQSVKKLKKISFFIKII